jgi:predicted acetyltransferase
MLELVLPDDARHAAWLAAHREWGPGLHEDGFGLGADDDVESAEGFSAWVSRLRSLPAARMWWIADGDDVLGGVALRTTTTDTVLRLGHVGYGIRPSARGRGVATWALGELLPRARAAGLTRLLLVCRDDNVGSIKTIERHAGILEKVVDDDDHGRVRHYRIAL